MTNKKQAAPTTTPPPAEAPPNKTYYEEFWEALMFSPPVFVAWSFQYISTLSMGYAIMIMLMPLHINKVVEVLGGRGAWRVEAGEAPKTPMQRLVVACSIKGQYMIPPLVMMFYFRKPEESDDLLFVGKLFTSYLGLVAINAASGFQFSK